jgi:hypothetical protein
MAHKRDSLFNSSGHEQKQTAEYRGGWCNSDFELE